MTSALSDTILCLHGLRGIKRIKNACQACAHSDKPPYAQCAAHRRTKCAKRIAYAVPVLPMRGFFWRSQKNKK